MQIHRRAVPLAIACAIGLLAGCGDPRGDNWQEVKALKARVAELEKQLDECRNGPDRLLQSAQASLDKGEYEVAIGEAKNLISWHPRAPEVAQAEEIIRRATEVLAAAEAGRQAEAAEREAQATAARAAALKQLAARRDDAKGVTYYRHRAAPEYLNARSVLAPYIVVDHAGRAYLMLRNVRVAKEMLGISAVTVTADGRRFEFPETFQRDSDDVSAWEWSESAVATGQREMLAAVAQAKNASIRYEGDNGSADRTITAAEKTLVREVLAAYDALSAVR